MSNWAWNDMSLFPILGRTKKQYAVFLAVCGMIYLLNVSFEAHTTCSPLLSQKVKHPGTKVLQAPFNIDNILWFAPQYRPQRGMLSCSDLSKNNGESKYLHLPEAYLNNFRPFKKHLDKVVKMNPERIEPNTEEFAEQTMAYMAIANQSFVRTICEIGFNTGHSALAYLSANSKANVYSFDLGYHDYSRQMAKYLDSIFPGRLEVIWGSSTETIPCFIAQNPSFKCDLLIVDGGHWFSTSKSDIENFRYLANVDHLLIVDDVPHWFLRMVGWAWWYSKLTGTVKPVFQCAFYKPRYKGFVIGQYIHTL